MQSAELKAGGLDASYYLFTQDVEEAIFEAMAAVRARSKEQPPARPPILLLRAGYAESPGWFLLQATEFDPEPITVASLRVRDTYASESLVQALLEILASEKWLDRRSNGEYYLSLAGREMSERSRSRMHAMLKELSPLPDDEMAELEGLLSRVIEAALTDTTHEQPWCLAHSRNRAPDATALHLDRIRQYLEDLNALRDDAHMAAWKPYCSDGYIWEAFTFVAEGQANTAAQLFDALAYRGYSVSDYHHALEHLEQQDLTALHSVEKEYGITQAGRDIRSKVELATDEYYFASWDHLTGSDRDRLRSLLEQLRDNCRSFASEVQE